MVKRLLLLALIPSALQAANIFAPGDNIFGVHLDAGNNALSIAFAGTVPGINDFPTAESPDHVIDGQTQKYLNFAKLYTGFMVSPSFNSGGGSLVTGMQLWTANDEEPRDPASYELYGTMQSLNHNGMNLSQFTLISSGPLALPSSRSFALDPASSQTVTFANVTPYLNYLVLFPTVKNEPLANSMQIGEVQLIGTVPVPERHTVTNLADSGAGSLRDTISLALDSDRISFAPDVRGKIRLTSGELFINKRLTIEGPGAAQLAISGNNNSRVVNIGSQGNVDINGLTITEGLAQGANGAPHLSAGGAAGGGIYNAGTLSLSGCMITTNRAQGGRGGDGALGGPDVNAGYGGFAQGGAIQNFGPLTLAGCTLLGNVARGGNGGNGGYDEFFTVAGDGGDGGAALGGAIWSGSQPIVVVNCTFSDNRAQGGAGGFPAVFPGAEGVPGFGGSALGGALNGIFVLQSCTIASNAAEGGGSVDPNKVARGIGGGAYNGANGIQSESPSAGNCIIAQNTVSGGFGTRGPDIDNGIDFYPWISLGWNLIGVVNGSSGWTADDFLGATSFPLNPLLGPCQDNGGPVWTMCPLPDSPARDKGKSGLATDAREGQRIMDFPTVFNAASGDGSDIGAVEVDSLFRIVSINKSNTVARVRFKSDPGSTYTLQQTSVITNRTWTNVVATRMAGTGQNLEATDSAAGVPRRFYRVVAEPLAINEREFVTDFSNGLPPGVTLFQWSAAPQPVVSNGVLHLTEAVGTQNNGMILDDFIGGATVASFVVRFKVRLGDVSTNGPADGFSVSFGPDISNASFIGEEGVGSALRVTFDTWDNGPLVGDPLSDFDAPSIEIIYDKVIKANVSMAGNRFGGRAPGTAIPTDPATGQPMTLPTGDKFADAEIRLDPDGTIDVWYKGVKVLDNVATGYVPTAGRFAFGARTGGAWTTHYFDDLQIIVAQ